MKYICQILIFLLFAVSINTTPIVGQCSVDMQSYLTSNLAGQILVYSYDWKLRGNHTTRHAIVDNKCSIHPIYIRGAENYIYFQYIEGIYYHLMEFSSQYENGYRFGAMKKVSDFLVRYGLEGTDNETVFYYDLVGVKNNTFLYLGRDYTVMEKADDHESIVKTGFSEIRHDSTIEIEFSRNFSSVYYLYYERYGSLATEEMFSIKLFKYNFSTKTARTYHLGNYTSDMYPIFSVSEDQSYALMISGDYLWENQTITKLDLVTGKLTQIELSHYIVEPVLTQYRNRVMVFNDKIYYFTNEGWNVTDVNTLKTQRLEIWGDLFFTNDSIVVLTGNVLEVESSEEMSTAEISQTIKVGNPNILYLAAITSLLIAIYRPRN